MLGAVSWSYPVYEAPMTEWDGPIVTRLAPSADGLHLEWLPTAAPVTVYVRLEGTEEFLPVAESETNEADFCGLADGEDYEVYIESAGKKSRVRLFRTGEAIGTVVNYLHPRDEAYAFSGRSLCSPCLIRHPDGHLLASMDVFEANNAQNLEMIFRSDDEGKTWHLQCQLYPCFWGRMFLHKGALYMVAASTEYGDLLIGRSGDGGKTFSAPTVLFRGGCKCDHAGIHKNPQPPMTYNGRVWMTMEWGSWALGYHAAMVASFPEDGDPLDVSQWRFTPPVAYDPNWEGVAKGPSSGNIEGTLAVLPDGKLYNIMRYDMTRTEPNYGLVLAYLVNDADPDAPLTYHHAIPFDGNHTKFMIRKDEKTGNYYSIISRITDARYPRMRNLLSLVKSADCYKWEVVCDLFDRRDEDPQRIGFQYVDFFMEGDDILYLCRTAMNEPRNYHDSNYSTFHRIERFREL